VDRLDEGGAYSATKGVLRAKKKRNCRARENGKIMKLKEAVI